MREQQPRWAGREGRHAHDPHCAHHRRKRTGNSNRFHATSF